MLLNNKKYLIFSLITAFIVIMSVIAGYLLISVGGRTYRLYRHIKSPEGRGWEGIVHEADAMLGFRPVPMAEGFEILPDGKTVMKVMFDEKGCRIPYKGYSEEWQSTRGPKFLFLGCSFTFGSACHAEDTFPFLVAERTGGVSVNAGVISYGFPQMILRARELIPEIKPSFVVMQLSPWLVFRGTSMYRPTRYGKVPVPYFAKVNGEYVIAPPVYRTNIFDVPIRDHMDTKESLSDMVSFYIRVGIPFFVYSDIQDSYTMLRKLSGKLPAPVTTSDMGGLERYIYGEIGALCSENNSVFIVLSLFFNENISPSPTDRWNPNFLFVYADEALMREAAKTDKSYDEFFKHVGKDPSVIVDSHPNPRAHGIIADEIYAELKKWALDNRRENR
ncbi:MAG: hypothetical protein WCV56_04830 [Candidatus Omnitrophota bacterium]